MNKVLKNVSLNLILTSKKYVINTVSTEYNIIYSNPTHRLISQYLNNDLINNYLSLSLNNTMILLSRDSVYNGIHSIQINDNSNVYTNKGLYMYSGSSRVGFINNKLGIVLITGSITNNHSILYNNLGYILEYKFNCNIYLKLLMKTSNPTWSSSINYTYITTIGLYDLNNNLLAVGRLSRPVKRVGSQIFLIKILV